MRLGLLVDPTTQTVHVYRPQQAPVLLMNPESVDCAPEFPGFVRNTRTLFELTL